MNLNKVFILGNLTRDPELRSTPAGQSVASFGIATNSFYTDKNGQKQKRVEFHNVVVWGRQAEIASQFLKKGSLALIEGRLQTREWQTRAGERRSTTEIIAERIQFGPRSSGAGAPQGEKTNEVVEEQLPEINIEDPEIKVEDIPF
jgi:single-strand DNA-binding protein